jgi:hypothetical protein
MALTYRGTKGSPLTIAEIDSNFAYFTGSHSITGSLTTLGDIIVTGSIEVSGSIIPNVGNGELTSSFDLGSSTAAWKDIYVSQGSIKFLVLSGSTSSSVVLSATDNGLSINNGPSITSTGYSGSFAVTGSITSSGDIVFTTSSSGVIQTINEFTPTGVASGSLNALTTTTTTYLKYGINIVATGSLTSSSYCCRLPEVPKKGKSVTIINKNGAELFVFPSTASGDINGQIDGYFTIPPDGQSYTFNCYENPLPGGWSTSNIPNGNIMYNTGEITYNATSSFQRLSFINQSTKVLTNGVTTGTVFWTGNPVELGIEQGGIFPYPFAYYIPVNTWKYINSISIRTNVTGSFRGDSGLTLATQANAGYSYAGGTTPYTEGWPTIAAFPPIDTFSTMLLGWGLQNGVGNPNANSWTWAGTPSIYQPFNSVVPGTFVSASGNPYISAGGVGAPGTMRMTWNINPYYNTPGAPIAKMVGKNYVGTALGSVYNANTSVSTPQLFDCYWFHSLSPYLSVAGYAGGNYIQNINNVKFQMTLNITPN